MRLTGRRGFTGPKMHAEARICGGRVRQETSEGFPETRIREGLPDTGKREEFPETGIR